MGEEQKKEEIKYVFSPWGRYKDQEEAISLPIVRCSAITILAKVKRVGYYL